MEIPISENMSNLKKTCEGWKILNLFYLIHTKTAETENLNCRVKKDVIFTSKYNVRISRPFRPSLILLQHYTLGQDMHIFQREARVKST